MSQARTLQSSVQKTVQKGAVWLLGRMQKRVPYSPSNHFLEGPFAPLREEHSSDALSVTGTIPHELDGLLTRIGPNPLHVENPATYHWFLGDGMVHGLRIKDGKALWYRNRYVGSDSVSRHFGRQPAAGSRRGVSDVVNTNIIGHGGSLWALVEAGSYPVELDAELNTVKHGLFDSTVQNGFTAHPHTDPDSGELHAICYDGFVHNKVRYLVIDKNRLVRRNVAIPVKHGPMMHDCAITEKNVLLLDLPVTFSVATALKGAGLPYAWNPSHQARVGRLPREGEAEDIRWFALDEPCFVFHSCNAFEKENGDTVLDVVVHERMFDKSLQGPEEQQVTFERWTLQENSGRVQRDVISRETQEFPRLDERRTGKPYRYAYAVGIDIANPAPNALLRHDLQTGESTRHVYGEGWMSGEVVFVPKHAEAKENEGWLLSYVHRIDGGNSRVVILDAENIEAEPVAVIELPVRVPLGFHGNWIASQ